MSLRSYVTSALQNATLRGIYIYICPVSRVERRYPAVFGLFITFEGNAHNPYTCIFRLDVFFQPWKVWCPGGYGGLVIEGDFQGWKSNQDISFFPINCINPQNASNAKSVSESDQPKIDLSTGQHRGLKQKCGTRTSSERSFHWMAYSWLFQQFNIKTDQLEVYS